MKYIRTYESFKYSNTQKVNEEFIGNILKGLVPNWLKNINVKNSGKIDKSFKNYEEKYKEVSKDLSAVLDSKDQVDKNRLSKIQSALVKKRDLLTKELNREISVLTKDNEKSKNYANFKRNAIDMKLIDFELDQYRDVGLEDNEYIEKLKNNSLEAKKKKEEAENQLKKSSAKDEQEKSAEEITKDNLTPGEILQYRNSKDERSIVKITDDGSIQRISDTITKDKYDEEMKKPEDQKNLISLFKKEEGEPFSTPHDEEYDRLTRISKKAQDKFR